MVFLALAQNWGGIPMVCFYYYLFLDTEMQPERLMNADTACLI